MNRFTVILTAIFSILSCNADTLALGEVIDSICAIVDDEIILESEVAYGIHTLLLESDDRYPTPEKLTELRSQVLEAYIFQKVLIANALEGSLMVEDRVVDKELERKLEGLIRQIGSKEKLVEYFDRPFRQIKREMRKGVRNGLLIDRLKQQKMTQIHIRRQEVIDFYREYGAELPQVPERVVMSHIMLNVKPSAEARREAEERIHYIGDIIKGGADFDSLATEFSEDPTAPSGGKLGFTERGDLVREYEEVAFQLEPGEVSEITESRYGLHLIRLIERQGERISTQHILIKLSPNQEDLQRVIERAEELTRSIRNGEDFAELARLHSDDTDTAPDGGLLEEIATNDLPVEFRDVIISLEEGQLSEPFETVFGVHFIRLEERLPVRGVSLTEDWQVVEQYALDSKRERIFRQWVEDLKKDHYIWPEWL